jgi:hypothetical protein
MAHKNLTAACSVGSAVFAGHPAAMLGLATLAYALVSTVTRYCLSPTKHCVTELRSVLSILTARGGGGS